MTMSDTKDIGSVIQDYITSKYSTVENFFNAVMAEHIGEIGIGSKTTFKRYMRCIFVGRFYGTTSFRKKNEANLRKLSIVLWYAGMDLNHEIIKGITDFEPRFEFPPQGYELSGCNNDSSNLECMVA